MEEPNPPLEPDVLPPPEPDVLLELNPPELDPKPPPELLLEPKPPPELLLDEGNPPELPPELELPENGSPQQAWATRSPHDMLNCGSGLAHGWFGEMHVPPALKQSFTPPELDPLPPPEVLPEEGAPLEEEPDDGPPLLELDDGPPLLDPELLPDPPELDELPPELVEPLEEPEPPSRSSPIGSVVPPHAATTGSKARYRRTRIQCAVGSCDWSMTLIGQWCAVL